MKGIAFAIILALQVTTIEQNKRFSPDTQIKLLKAERQLQQVQVQITELQRQFEQLSNTTKQLKMQMEADCAAEAKTASIDLSKYNCDLDQLAFVPKPIKPQGS